MKDALRQAGFASEEIDVSELAADPRLAERLMGPIRGLDGSDEPRRLAISDGGANTARWGSDGRLYFLSGRSGSSQVWRAASSSV